MKLRAVHAAKNDCMPAKQTVQQDHNECEIIFVNQAEYTEALSAGKRPNPLWVFHKKKKNAGRKALAAVLAFPLPFGVIGLHRIYLGTKPYVPLIYIGTLGGGFGILPFIDFWVILLDKDIEHYRENSHIFMWIENQEKKPETTNSYD